MSQKMKWGQITATQDEDTWFEDYVHALIGADLAPLPPHSMRIASSKANWFETGPGKAFIYAEEGSPDDQRFAREVLREALAGHGIEQQRFHIDWDKSDAQLMKESKWPDIEAKAKRLIESGKVQILRNAPEVVVGQVEGDDGTYQTEINRDDPNSESVTMWKCDCPWDQFAWQRTRQWKKYEGRMCSHVLATLWQARMTPADEEIPEDWTEEPATQSPPPGVGGTMAPSPYGSPGMVPPGASPMLMGPPPPPAGNAPVPPGIVPGQSPEQGLIPPYPANPENMPAMNPVSVPGQKPQTPLNPVQNAGGTFSHVAASAFVNGDIVQAKEENMGELVGLGGGGQAPIPANSIGEVLGTDPTTGLVFVYFAGPQAEAGKLEPHGVQAWFFPGEIIARPDIRQPGPAIRRRT